MLHICLSRDFFTEYYVEMEFVDTMRMIFFAAAED